MRKRYSSQRWQPNAVAAPTQSKPTRLTQLEDKSTSLVKILINSAVLGLFCFFIAIVFMEVFGDSEKVILEPITIPEEYIRAGYTDVIISEKLLDEARKIRSYQQTVSIYYLTKVDWANNTDKLLAEAEVEARKQDIPIPGTSVTFRSLVRFLREIFSRKTNYLRGEITKNQSRLNLNIRNTNPLGAPAAIFSANGDLDELIKEHGGKAILVHIAPKIVMISDYYRFLENFEDSKIKNNALNVLTEKLDYFKKYPNDGVKSLAYHLSGISLDKFDKQKQAIAEFEKAVKFDSSNAFIYNSWGNVLFDTAYFDDKVIEDAKNKYNKAVEIDPNFAIAHVSLGNCYHELGDDEKAMKQYEIATEKNPKFSLAWHNWGELLTILGKKKEAQEKYNKAEALGYDHSFYVKN